MKRALVLAFVCIACKTEKPEPIPSPVETAENPYRIEDDDVPVAPDYEEEALKAVTPENVEAEVAKMEKDLESSLPADR